jgi:hypothetical protein
MLMTGGAVPDAPVEMKSHFRASTIRLGKKRRPSAELPIARVRVRIGVQRWPQTFLIWSAVRSNKLEDA